MLLLSRSRRILRAVAITVGVLGFSAVVALLPKPVAAAVTDAGVGVFPDHNGRVFVLEGRFFHDRGFGRGSIATPGFSRSSIATPGFSRGSIATSGFIRGGFAAPSMMRGGGR